MFAAATSPVSAAGSRERFRLRQRGLEEGRVVVPVYTKKEKKSASSSLLLRTTRACCAHYFVTPLSSPRISTDARRRKKRLVSTTPTPTSTTRVARERELVTARTATSPPPETRSASEILSSPFIPLSFRKLEELAVDLMSPGVPRQTTLEFVKVVRTLFHLECFGARDRMKHYVYYHASPNDRLGYEQFDLNDMQVTAALEDIDSAAVHRANQEQLTTVEEFDALSTEFIADFCALLRNAYYSPLTQKEWDLAQAEQFMFTLPCTVKCKALHRHLTNRDNLDDTLMRDFLRGDPALHRAFPAEFKNTMALFHRGHGVARAKGWFFAEKIDLLVQMCIVEPFLWLLGRPRAVFAEQFASWDEKAAGVVARLESEKERVVMAVEETMELTKEAIEENARRLASGLGGQAEVMTSPRPNGEEVEGEEGGGEEEKKSGRVRAGPVDSDTFDYSASFDNDGQQREEEEEEEPWEGLDDSTIVERLTLRRLLPTPRTVLRKFFSKLELQDPTYKEVVLLYRLAKPRKGEKAGPTGAGPLILKSYKDIPLADLDMIFPEVYVTVKFKDVLVNIVLGLAALGTFLYSQINGIDLSIKANGAIGAMAFKVTQSAVRLLQAQNKYAGMMAKAVASKSADSQLGMLINLLESMEDQECKEMILCYCVLSSSSIVAGRFRAREMTMEEIELACEYVLYNRFGLKVNFDAEGTVERLVKKGLVERRRGGIEYKYAAIPLDRAMEMHPLPGGNGGMEEPWAGGMAVA